MDLVHLQQCESLEHYHTIEIESHSSPGKIYTVMIQTPEDEIDDFICDCEGYKYRGFCSHQEEALLEHCLWKEDTGPEKQTEDEKAQQICPRCGRKTRKLTVIA